MLVFLNAGLEVEDFAGFVKCSSPTVQGLRLRAKGATVQSLRCEVEVVGFVLRVSYKVTARILGECLCICFSFPRVSGR